MWWADVTDCQPECVCELNSICVHVDDHEAPNRDAGMHSMMAAVMS